MSIQTESKSITDEEARILDELREVRRMLDNWEEERREHEGCAEDEFDFQDAAERLHKIHGELHVLFHNHREEVESLQREIEGWKIENDGLKSLVEAERELGLNEAARAQAEAKDWQERYYNERFR